MLPNNLPSNSPADESPGSPGPVEVEIKLRVVDLPATLARIREAGFAEIETPSFEANVLYDTAEQALRGNQNALRLREYRGRTVLTFKGKPLPGRHKRREELETVVENGAVMAKVLERLGYQPLFRYEKFRSVFGHEGDAGVITLDETPIGTFLELEGEAGWIDRTAARLGFAVEDYVTASYATLYLEHCKGAGIEPAHFVFPAADSE
ncbi:MAG: class IV adenylate cyclase [Bryobacterales bacterium]|nr:class IV adenylate cyclase [Bryobacterales bacterium]